MKALLIVFFLPNANTPFAMMKPDFFAVQTDNVAACEVYAQALTKIHAENEDPRTLKVSCQAAGERG